MSNVVEATLEEKLEILSSLDIKTRLEKAIELLTRQVGNIKGNVKITSITSNTANLDLDQMSKVNKDRMRRGMGSGIPFGSGFGGMNGGPPMPGGPNGEPEEPNEIDELKQKLDDAKLTSEASKVAEREMKRLKQMNPQQAEYNVSLASRARCGCLIMYLGNTHLFGNSCRDPMVCYDRG
jgi:ATP-dependent Lon protease